MTYKPWIDKVAPTPWWKHGHDLPDLVLLDEHLVQSSTSFPALPILNKEFHLGHNLLSVVRILLWHTHVVNPTCHYFVTFRFIILAGIFFQTFSPMMFYRSMDLVDELKLRFMLVNFSEFRVLK
jgi:hypothetical protein